jgi:hypothetical protein
MFKSSKDLLKAYKNGFVGSWCDPEDTDKLLGELPQLSIYMVVEKEN